MRQKQFSRNCHTNPLKWIHCTDEKHPCTLERGTNLPQVTQLARGRIMLFPPCPNASPLSIDLNPESPLLTWKVAALRPAVLTANVNRNEMTGGIARNMSSILTLIDCKGFWGREQVLVLRPSPLLLLKLIRFFPPLVTLMMIAFK